MNEKTACRTAKNRIQTSRMSDRQTDRQTDRQRRQKGRRENCGPQKSMSQRQGREQREPKTKFVPQSKSPPFVASLCFPMNWRIGFCLAGPKNYGQCNCTPLIKLLHDQIQSNEGAQFQFQRVHISMSGCNIISWRIFLSLWSCQKTGLTKSL